jgi:hypothetical protein
MKMKNVPTDDFRRFISCLNLTQSDKDGEALSACRHANKIIAKYGMTWSSVLVELEGRLRTEIAEAEPTLDTAFAQLLKTVKPGNFRDLIVQFHKRWTDHGVLSDKQRKVITDALKRNRIHLGWSVRDEVLMGESI